MPTEFRWVSTGGGIIATMTDTYEANEVVAPTELTQRLDTLYAKHLEELEIREYHKELNKFRPELIGQEVAIIGRSKPMDIKGLYLGMVEDYHQTKHVVLTIHHGVQMVEKIAPLSEVESVVERFREINRKYKGV